MSFFITLNTTIFKWSMFHKTVSYLCYFHLAAGTGGRKYFGHSCLVLSRSLSLLLIIIMSSLKIGQSSNLKNHSILTRSGPFSSCFILLMYSSQVRSFGLIVCWKISYENIFLIAREFSQFNDNLILKKQRGFEPVQQHRRCRKSSLRKLNFKNNFRSFWNLWPSWSTDLTPSSPRWTRMERRKIQFQWHSLPRNNQGLALKR